MSRHLGVLRRSGLVEVELAEARDWFDRIEAQWRDQLAGFSEFVERQQSRDDS